MRSRPDIKAVLAAARRRSLRTGILVAVGLVLATLLGFYLFYEPYDPRSGIPDVINPAMVGSWEFVDVRAPAWLADRSSVRSIMQELRNFGRKEGMVLRLEADGKAAIQDGKGVVGGKYVWGWDGNLGHGSHVPTGREKPVLFRFTIELQADDTLLWRAGRVETDWPWPGMQMIYRRMEK